jgi:hypothetical protein
MKNGFPILGSEPTEYIPLDLIKPHEQQAVKNHMQSLEKLASRGGLSWVETLFVLNDKPYNYKSQLTEESARVKVLEIVDAHKNKSR